jgi:hypothetical protein
MVSSSALRLENVAGSQQAVSAGQPFQPIWVRVTDSAVPVNPVIGASVVFHSTLLVPHSDLPVVTTGESVSSQYPQRIILGSSQSTIVSNANGLVSLTPSTGGLNRALDVDIQASAGSGAWLEFQLEELPQLAQAVPGVSNGAPRRGEAPVQRSKPPQAIAHDPPEIDESGVSSPSGNTSHTAIPRTYGFAVVAGSNAATLRGEDGCGDDACRKALDRDKECSESPSHSEKATSSEELKACAQSDSCRCR